MRKLLSILIALVMVFSMLPTGFITASAEQSGDYQYIVNNGFATITKYNGVGGDITIPSKLDDYIVNRIEGYSVYGSQKGAFQNSSVTNVVIPIGVLIIGKQAFQNCHSLTNAYIPDSVIMIEMGAFGDCSNLTSINIPDSVEYLGYAAFGWCNNLASLTIGKGVITIGESAFRGCSSLTSVIIPNNVKYLQNQAFSDCIKLQSVVISNSVLNIGDYAFWQCNNLSNITIPEGVSSIGMQAFEGCSKLTHLIIPNSVSDIGQAAFSSCLELKSVIIGSGIKSISQYAFGCCPLLTAVYFLGDSPQLQGSAYPFQDCAATFKVYYNENSVDFSSPWYVYSTSVFTALTDPVFSISTPKPTIKDITVSIEYSNIADVKEYKIGSGIWIEYTNPLVLSSNNTILARSTDVFGNIGNISTLIVSNIYKLVENNSSTTIIDRDKHFIYGLEKGLTKNIFESSFVQIYGNAHLIYDTTHDILGTGTKVNLINNATNQIMDTYYIIVFGDVNSDGNIDSIDAGTMVDAENYMFTWDPVSDAAYIKAGDLNGDGTVDSIDAGIAVDIENYMMFIDQSTGIAIPV